MPATNAPVTVAVLAIPEITASTLYGMYDVFSGVGRDWAFRMTGSPGEPLMRPVCSTGMRPRPTGAIVRSWRAVTPVSGCCPTVPSS